AVWPILRAIPERARLRASLPRALACAAGSLLVLLPVAARNHRVGRVWLPTTSGAGTNVYAGNNLENPTRRATEVSFVRGIPEHEYDDWRREAERRTGRALDPAQVSAFWLGETLRSARERPLAHLSILGSKLCLTLGSYEVPDNHFYPWDVQ